MTSLNLRTAMVENNGNWEFLSLHFCEKIANRYLSLDEMERVFHSMVSQLQTQQPFTDRGGSRA